MTTVTLSNGTILVDGTVPPGDTSATITAGTTYLELDNYNIYLQGTLDNAGTLWIDSTGDNTNLILEGTTNTLTGGGTILLSDNPYNRIYGAGGSTDTLINVNNTIEGAGQIGVNNSNIPLALTNEAAGIIDANAATYSLVIETGGPAVVNDGLMEATNAGGLVIYGGTTINQTGGGKMLASGAGNIYLENGSEILGGTLRGTLGGEFIVTNGGANLGGTSSSVLTIAAATTVQVADNNNLYLLGSIDNNGTLEANSTGDNTNIILDSATVSLTGGGTLLLSDNINNRLYGNGSGTETLINVNNTIAGAGQIGVNNSNIPLALTNKSAGIIDANQSVDLVIQTGGPALVNTGLMEATNTGGLVVYDSTIDNTGGTLLASGAGHNVYLQSSDIVGGSLRGTGGGSLLASSGATLDGSEGAAITIAATTTVQVVDNNNLYLLGTIDNIGTLAEDSTGDTTNIILNSATVSLTGGGTLLLSDNPNNRLYGNGSGTETLINVNNTIAGAGQIGVNNSNIPLALTNALAGIINANAATYSLVIETGGPALVNAGLIEATGAGGLVIYESTIDENGGTLLASGAGNDVYLESADIVGGPLLGTGGGSFVATADTTLDGSEGAAITISAATTVQDVDNNNLYLLGTIDNLGTLAEDSTVDTTNIILDSATVSLTGGGTLLLSNSGANRIYGNNGADDTLINVNNTIQGAGQIGVNNSNIPLALINESAAIIDANQSSGLVIQTGGPTLINDGLLEATGAGSLFISNTTVDQTGGGKILSSGTAAVYLENGADILGGTLVTTLGGEIFISSGSASFGALTSNAAVTIAAASTVQVADNNNLYLYGPVDNLGTLALDSTGDATRIILSGPTISLTGGGTLLLSDNANNQIYGLNSGDDTLINVNNTIAGAGLLGVNNGNVPLALTNESGGIIDGNQSTALVIETGGPTLINDGLLEATGSGGLNIYDTTINQTGGGKILASGTGAVYLEAGADILGGTLRTTLGGEIYITNGGASFGALTSNAAVTIAAKTTVQVVDNNNLYLYGKVDNLGTLELDSTGDATRIILNGPTVSLTGGGTLLLSDNANNQIYGSTTTDDNLINVNNTIEGAGDLGVNNGNVPLALTNDSAGIIDANQSSALVIETGGPVMLNAGLLEATGSGGLEIYASSVTNSATGTIAAHNASLVQFASNADLLNDVAGTLTGGAYAAYATTGSATLEIAGGGALSTDAAEIILSGTGSEISFWNGSAYQTIESSLTDVTGTGTLEILSAKNYSTANELTVNAGGVLDVVSGTLNAAGVDFLSGSSSRLIINAQSDIIGSFTAGGGTLELAADGTKVATLSANILSQLSHFGAVQIDTGAILDFTSSGSFGVGTKVVDDGRLETTATSTLVVNGSTVTTGAAGTIEALGSSLVQFDSNADLQNEVAGTLTGGDYIVTGSSKLELAGGGALTTDAAEIILSGTNAEISFWNGSTYQTIENSLTDVTGTGTLEIIGAKHYTTANKLTVSAGGVLDVAAGTLKAAGVDFLSGSSSRLIINAQSDIIGSFTAGGGTLEVAADGTKIAKLSANILGQLSNFGVVTVDSGAILEFTTAVSVGATTQLENSGTITESSTGLLTIDGSLTGTGTVDISQQPLTLNGSVGMGQNISFSGTSEVLDLGSPNSFGGTVENFAAGDTIDLTSVPIGSITAMTFVSGVLTLTEATGKIDITFANPSQFGADHFALFTDGAGTGITLSSAAVAGAAADPALTHAGAAPWQPAVSLASTALFHASGTLGG